jgi:hypothetical protein
MRQNSTMPVQVSMAGYVAAWGEILNMGFAPAFSGTVFLRRSCSRASHWRASGPGKVSNLCFPLASQPPGEVVFWVPPSWPLHPVHLKNGGV